MNNLKCFDKHTHGERKNIADNDNCYFFCEYTASRDFSYSEVNQLIKNLKISLDQKHRLQYKEMAIKKCANYCVKLFANANISKYIFVPIPPSKIELNDEYDDRLIKILKQVSSLLNEPLDVRELITATENTKSAHESSGNERVSFEKLESIYTVNQNLLPSYSQDIIIFDDVLTTGAHFKAVKEKILSYYDSKLTPNIIGLFIALAVYEKPNLD